MIIMGLFNVCDGSGFCLLSTEKCKREISAPEVFDFLKAIGVTSENIDVYTEAFKKWIALGVCLTPLNVVYLAEKNHLVSLPFFDLKSARFVVGIEIKGTCFFAHYQKKKTAPLMSWEQAHSFLEERTFELLKIEKRPRMLTFPTAVDLKNWSEEDPHVAQTLSIINLDCNYVSRHILSYMRCGNGIYWIDPTLEQSLARIYAKLDYDNLELCEPQSKETYCRAMAVSHLDLRYDFRGEFTAFGELTPETYDVLTHLRQFAETV